MIRLIYGSLRTWFIGRTEQVITGPVYVAYGGQILDYEVKGGVIDGGITAVLGTMTNYYASNGNFSGGATVDGAIDSSGATVLGAI
jgi:hypothetical protein